MKSINYNLSNKNTAFYIGVLLLLCAHLIHFVSNNYKLIILFKILFILGYLSFNISELMSKGHIHIADIIMRTSIIVMIIFSIYYNYYHYQN